MNARSLSILLALSFAAVSFTPALAHAQQVSDADRTAARDLYNEGYSLQQAGKYADAVDRYNRSLAVFPAPTTAYRLAQCRAALGQLVEAAEEYRAIGNAALPANPPEAFVKAKQESAAELQALEPRIPKLKINVLPAGIAGLSVTIDNVAVPSALVGVARAVNPGSHRVAASAPGYSPSQTQVDIRERQQPTPEVTLTLQPGGGGVSYTTQPPPNGGNTGTNPNPNPNGGGTYQGGAYQNPNGGYNPYGQWVPPRRRPQGPRNALMLGVDASVVIPVGTFSSSADDLNASLGTGFSVGVDVGLRLARVIYLGAMVQPSFYGNDGFGVAVAGLLGFMSNPEGVGFYGELGGAYRYFHALNTNGKPLDANGGDVILGLGIQIKAGNFRVIPKVELFVGPHNTNDYPGSNGVHAFFNFGLAAYWERPLDRPVVNADVNVAPTY